MIGIYKITSPSNKVYIGQAVDILKRWKHYKLLLCKSQIKIYNSLQKHGVENHIFEIIELCDVEYLNEREGYWQDFYEVVNKGLNCRRVKSVDKSGYDSQETKDKRSASLRGRKQTPEHYAKSEVTHFKPGRVPHNKGIPRTKEEKDNQSYKMKDRVTSEETKRLQSINSTVNKIVFCTLSGKKWKSATICAKDLGMVKSTLSGMLNGNIKNTKVKTLIYL